MSEFSWPCLYVVLLNAKHQPQATKFSASLNPMVRSAAVESLEAWPLALLEIHSILPLLGL